MSISYLSDILTKYPHGGEKKLVFMVLADATADVDRPELQRLNMDYLASVCCTRPEKIVSIIGDLVNEKWVIARTKPDGAIYYMITVPRGAKDLEGV